MSEQSTFEFMSPSEEIRAINKGQIKGAWYNRCDSVQKTEDGRTVRPHTIYVDNSKEPKWNPADAAFDVDQFNKGLNAIKSGSTDIGKITEDPWIEDWKKVAHKRAQVIKSAGVGYSQDYAAIDIVNILGDFVNTELRAFSLEQAVTPISVPELTVRIDAWTRFTAQEDIAEGQEPILKLGSAARTTYDLVKHGGATGLTFEAMTRASRDIYRANVDNLVSDLKRIKSKRTATELELFTDVGAGDWAAYTTDHSTRSPFDDIGTITDTITANNGTPNTIASHDKVFRDFIANTHVNGFVGPDHSGTFSSARVINNIPGLPGFTWYIDNEKTSTIATIYDKSAIVGFQGPIRTATISEALPDQEIYRIFDFYLPKIIIAGRGRDLTSVTA
jgi:hypothetical protein